MNWNTFIAGIVLVTLAAPFIMCVLVKLTALIGFHHYKRKGNMEMASRYHGALQQSSIRFLWNAFQEEQAAKQ